MTVSKEFKVHVRQMGILLAKKLLHALDDRVSKTKTIQSLRDAMRVVFAPYAGVSDSSIGVTARGALEKTVQHMKELMGDKGGDKKRRYLPLLGLKVDGAAEIRKMIRSRPGNTSKFFVYCFLAVIDHVMVDLVEVSREKMVKYRGEGKMLSVRDLQMTKECEREFAWLFNDYPIEAQSPLISYRLVQFTQAAALSNSVQHGKVQEVRGGGGTGKKKGSTKADRAASTTVVAEGESD